MQRHASQCMLCYIMGYNSSEMQTKMRAPFQNRQQTHDYPALSQVHRHQSALTKLTQLDQRLNELQVACNSTDPNQTARTCPCQCNRTPSVSLSSWNAAACLTNMQPHVSQSVLAPVMHRSVTGFCDFTLDSDQHANQCSSALTRNT